MGMDIFFGQSGHVFVVVLITQAVFVAAPFDSHGLKSLAFQLRRTQRRPSPDYGHGDGFRTRGPKIPSFSGFKQHLLGCKVGFLS